MLRALLLGAFVLVPVAAASTIVVPVDQPTIQAAVNAAVDGDVIEIHAGVYPEAVLLTNKTNLALNGKGKVRIVAPIDGYAMTLAACSNVTLQKLRFEGPGTGLNVNGGGAITVSKCRFQYLDVGILAAGCVGASVEDNVFLDIRDRAVLANSSSIAITGNRVQRARFGVYLGFCALTVSDNKLRDMLHSGIYVLLPTADVDSSIEGNLIDRCGVCGIRCDSVTMTTAQFTVSQNVIRNVTYAGISGVLKARVIIEKNTIRGAGTVGMRFTLFPAPEQIVILGNEVRKVRGFGIDVSLPSQPTLDVAVTDNVVVGAGLDGVVTNAATLSGNDVLKCGRFGVQLIDAGSTSLDHVTLTGNTLLGSQLLDLYDTSAFNSILPDNTIGSTGP